MPDLLIDTTSPSASATSILFICTGNICRSPLAEVMARAMFDGDSFTFSSVGTHAVTGSPTTPHAQTIARGRSLDLSGHRATHLGASTPPPDIVIGMEERHLVVAAGTFPSLDRSRIRLLDMHRPVADPYRGDLAAYETAAAHIETALETLPMIDGDITGHRNRRR